MKFGLLATILLLACQPAESGVGQYQIQFREHLQVSDDLKLTGAQASSSLRFLCESSWKPISGSTLHLFIDHSPSLDGSRSFLSITLNYGILRSVRLDDHNQATTEITIPLPPEMLQSENEIVFSVEQFPGATGAKEIWTSIKPSSFISIQYEEDHPALELRRLPAPIVDIHSYRPKVLSVLLPARPSSQTLEGTAALIANYAAKLGDEVTVRAVHSIDAVSGPLLIAGTPEEQPIRLLEDQLPFRFFRVGKEIRLGNKQGPFDSAEGVIALIERPGRTFTPILLATGNSTQAVSRAIRRLIEGHFEESGAFLRVPQDVQIVFQPRRQWRGFLPSDDHFTLAQMGLRELKFDSQNNFSLSVPIRATPDVEFLEYGHQTTLRFRFDADAGIEHTALNVDWNGSSLGRFDSNDFSAGSIVSVHLKIPGHLLRQQNVLKLTWHGLSGTQGRDTAAWLLPSSEFDLPRDYKSDLPDLGLLRSGLFPFSSRADLSDTIIVLPEDVASETTAALFEFAGLLGRLVPGDRFAFRVKRANEVDAQTRDSSNIIAFRIDESPKDSRAKKALATVQESVSNADRSRLNITSSSPAGLRAAIGTIFSEAVLNRLNGDTAYIYAEGPSSFKTTPVRQVSEYSYSTHLQAWLRENWIALPLILTMVSCLLFVGVRLALVQYKNRNLHRYQTFGLTSSNGPK
jgi:hypothetical protein